MLYIVMRRTGSYSDRSEEPVCWYSAEHLAEARVEKLNANKGSFDPFHYVEPCPHGDSFDVQETTRFEQNVPQAVTVDNTPRHRKP
jgi:hypothetical protein